MADINLSNLQKAQKAYIELLNATSFFGDSELSMVDEIKNSFRKIVLGNTFSNRQIICITGMQGVGKTTMVKNFYNISDEFFNIAISRGEKLPVLITEKNCTEPIMTIKFISKDNKGTYNIDTKIVNNTDEFVNATSGKDNNVIYVELLVPQMHTYNENVSFMLLPGFEMRKKTDYWEDLINYSVRCSDTAMFLLDASKFSNDDNYSKIKELTETLGENIIYVLTNSDRDENDNQEAKDNIASVLSVDKSRVVCVGSYEDEEKNEKWRNELKTTLSDYINNAGDIRVVCAEYILEEIRCNMRPALINLRYELKSSEGEMLKDNLERLDILELYDNKVAQFRKKYRSYLEDSLQESRSESRRKIDDYFKENPGILKNIKRFIFGTSVKDVIDINEIVRSAVMIDDGNKEVFVGINNCMDALSCLENQIVNNNSSRAYLVTTKQEIVPIETPNGIDFNNMVTTFEHTNIAPKVLNNVATLLNKMNYSTMLQDYSGSDPIRDAVTVIVELGTAHYCHHYMIPRTYDNVYADQGYVESSIEKSDLKDTKKFGGAVLGITGLDFIFDGKLDLITHIAELLCISTGIATVAVAGAAAMGAGISMGKDINRFVRNDYSSCISYVNAVYDEMIESCIDNYDNHMNEIRSVLEEKLIRVYGNNKNMIDKYNAINALNKIEESLREIQEDINGTTYEFGAYIGR